jgi:hypothetical protein
MWIGQRTNEQICVSLRSHVWYGDVGLLQASETDRGGSSNTPSISGNTGKRISGFAASEPIAGATRNRTSAAHSADCSPGRCL